jgi:hypothetical protein
MSIFVHNFAFSLQFFLSLSFESFKNRFEIAKSSTQEYGSQQDKGKFRKALKVALRAGKDVL